jgi:hypothetical protein
MKYLVDKYNISHVRIDIPWQSSIFYFPMLEERYRFPYEIKKFPERSKKITEYFENFIRKVNIEKQTEGVDESKLNNRDCNVVGFECTKAVFIFSFHETQIEEIVKFLMMEFEKKYWREHVYYFFEMKDLLYRHKYPHFSLKKDYEIFY